LGEYTYLLGLLIMGTIVFAFTMVSIERERRARRGSHRRDSTLHAN